MFSSFYYSSGNFREIKIAFSVISCHLKINVDRVQLIMLSGPASLLFIANYWIDKRYIKVIFLATTDVLWKYKTKAKLYKI